MTEQAQYIAEQIAHMEATIQAAAPAIAKGEQLQRLMDNKDFRELIMEGYLKDFAVDQVRMGAKPEMQGDREQAAVAKSLAGIGTLWGFFDAINAAGNHAITQSEQCKEALIEIENYTDEEAG